MGAKEDLKREIKDSQVSYVVSSALCFKNEPNPKPNGFFVYNDREEFKTWFEDLCGRIKEDPSLKLRVMMRPGKMYDVLYEEPDNDDIDEIFTRFSECESAMFVTAVDDSISFALQCIMAPTNLDPETNTDGILTVLRDNMPKTSNTFTTNTVLEEFEDIIKHSRDKWNKEHGKK